MSEILAELNSALFGDGMEISKFEPDSSDLAPWRKGKYKLTEKQKKTNHAARERRLARVGQAGNALAIAGGVHALGAAVSNPKLQGSKTGRGVYSIAQGAEKGLRKLPGGTRLAESLKGGTHGGAKLALAGVGLHVGELAGDAISAKFLHQAAEKPKKKNDVTKGLSGLSMGDRVIAGVGASAGVASIVQNHKQNKALLREKRSGARTRARLVAVEAGQAIEKAPATIKAIPNTRGELNRLVIDNSVERARKKIKKADIVFSGELSKLDTDKRQVFGWASVTQVDGKPVYDRQGDYIALEEVEKSAYHYVTHSRTGGDMHERAGEVPLKKSDMIESFIVTPEKLSKMGLAENSLPHGWWVGYQVNDEDLWQAVKEGKRVGFSIHGRGVRTPMEA